MADLTPRTRSENFLNGEDLEPITRREHFYAGRENELPEGHQEPETREEWFIQKYREAGDVTVESLSVTENGTYTAPSGKAYSPVSVNVPLPSNAYLLKSIEHEQVATFSDGTDNFVKSLEVAIEPIQSGSGEPSPTNIRPISGWDEVNVTRCGKNLVESTLANTTINTIGEINVSGGSSTFDMQIAKIIKGETYTVQSDESQNVNQKFVGGFFYDMPQLGSISYNNARLANTPATFTAPIDGYVVFRTSHNYTFAQIELGSTATTYEPYNGQTYTIDLNGTRYGGKLDVVNGIVTPAPYYASYNGETLTGEWISDRDKYEVGTTPTIGAQVVNIGASDTPVSITPTIIKSLQGENNFLVSTGDVERLQYWGKEVS